MKYSPADRFFLIFLATILTIRVFLLFFPIFAPSVGFYAVNHYLYGFVLIVGALATRNLTLYAIGWGLLADELMLFPMQARDWYDYFSPFFLFGEAAIVALVFHAREHLLQPILFPGERSHA